MSLKNKLWVEAYRPQTLDQYVFHDERLKASIEKMVEDRSIPHLLLTGVQGSGKTTLATILVDALGIDPSDLLLINASLENNVDTMRNKINDFISTYPFGEFKVVWLEEADRMSRGAQEILRKFLEEEFADVARFIMTGNYENRIIPAIKSRVQHFRFKAPNRDDVFEYAAKILLQEKVKFDLDLLEKYVATSYPDIRKIVNSLQQNSIGGKLLPLTESTDSSDYKFELLDLLTKDDWVKIRKLVCDNVAAEEWEDLYRFLYENLNKSAKFSKKDKWEEGILAIAEHLYKHGIVADPEINAAALFIRLSQV